MISNHGWALFTLGEYAQALEAAQASLGEAPEFPAARLCVTLSLAGLGRTEDARAAFQALDALAPRFLRTRLGGQWMYGDSQRSGHAGSLLRVAAGMED